jgi:ketosteroid isomerase-like protein
MVSGAVTVASDRDEFPGLSTVPVDQVLAALQSGDPLAPAKRVVLEWFRLLSAGELAGAYALMNPSGRYWVLRQRTTVTNERFGEIFTNAYTQTFADGITFTIGAVTAEAIDDRVQVSVVAEGNSVIAASGLPYRNMYHYLLNVQDGLIEDVCEFADTLRSTEAFAPPGSTT